MLQVSWLRHSDTHLLTAGRYTYTSDERFRAVHKVLSEDYILQIAPVQVRNITYHSHWSKTVEALLWWCC